MNDFQWAYRPPQAELEPSAAIKQGGQKETLTPMRRFADHLSVTTGPREAVINIARRYIIAWDLREPRI
jgi:hypothetical protein